MLDLKYIRISRGFALLLIWVSVAFISLGVLYAVQQSKEADAWEDVAGSQRDVHLLIGFYLKSLSLNKAVFEHFDKGLDAPSERLSEIQATLSSDLGVLKSKSQNTALISELNGIGQILDDFAKTLDELAEMHERLGENAKKGLLLDLAVTAEKFETTLLELKRNDIKSAVLNMRAQEKSLVDAPSSDSLTIIENDVHKLSELLSVRKLAPDEFKDVMSLLDEYSQKLRQLVSIAEGITAREQVLVHLGENLSVETLNVRSHIQDYFTEQSRAAYSNTIFLITIFAVCLAMFFAVTLWIIWSLRNAIVQPMGVISDGMTLVAEGDKLHRIEVSVNNEFAELAGSLNQMLDGYRSLVKKKKLEMDSYRREVSALTDAVTKITQEKVLVTSLPAQTETIQSLVSAVTELNREVWEIFECARNCTVKISMATQDLHERSLYSTRLSADEKKQVLSMSKALQLSLGAIKDIAARSTKSNEVLVRVLGTVGLTQEIVDKSTQSLAAIKESVAEMENRTEGMIELSATVQNTIKVVNEIADRSHILALNASMSSTDAALGCESIIEEVQQLAEHARNASTQVSLVIDSTQRALLDIVTINKKLVSRVKLGAELSEQVNATTALLDQPLCQLRDLMQEVSTGCLQQALFTDKIFQRSKVVGKYLDKSCSESKAFHGECENLQSLNQSLDQVLFTYKLANKVPSKSNFLGGMGLMSVELIDEGRSRDSEQVKKKRDEIMADADATAEIDEFLA